MSLELTPQVPEGVNGGATRHMFQHVSNSWVTQALYVAAKLGVADALAAGPQHSDVLATQLGTDAGATYRLLRMLASVGVFQEQPDGAFANTAESELLRDGIEGSQRAWLIAMIELGWRAWGELLHSVRTGTAAFPHVYGKSRYEVLDEQPELSAMFDRSMSIAAVAQARSVIEAYDWSAATSIVDVGGGDGTLLAAILRAAPAASGTLFERANVIEQARTRLAQEGVLARCELVAGDFFVDPIPAGDVLILKSVLHNWGDDHVRTLLARCKAALPASGKLVLIEPLIAPGNAPDFHKLADVHMLVMHGGRERTRAEYEKLLDASGLRVSSVVTTRAPVTGIVEAVHA